MIHEDKRTKTESALRVRCRGEGVVIELNGELLVKAVHQRRPEPGFIVCKIWINRRWLKPDALELIHSFRDFAALVEGVKKALELSRTKKMNTVR